MRGLAARATERREGLVGDALLGVGAGVGAGVGVGLGVLLGVGLD